MSVVRSTSAWASKPDIPTPMTTWTPLGGVFAFGRLRLSGDVAPRFASPETAERCPLRTIAGEL
jgi:hypothetical protein